MRHALHLAAVLLALGLGLASCAPPGDRPQPSEESATRQASPSASAVEQPDAAAEDAPAGPTRAASATEQPRRIVLQQLRGGVLVPRCPECGETQPTDAEQCAGCGQRLDPWRRETPCPQCSGSGACGHCGDDRTCGACETGGDCADCGGTGRSGDERCAGCRGRGRCSDCGGDGVRSSVADDFRPGESFEPGICTTCIDGSGLCPACGSGDDACLLCGAAGTCPGCGGDGACPWDRGDGLCATCGGAGHEVANGPPGTPADRAWQVRRDDGRLETGRVQGLPLPDLVLTVRKGDKESALALVPSKVNAVSYCAAIRDFTALDDARGRVRLAEAAAERGLFALARRELRRAGTIDPALRASLRTRLREVETAAARRWLEAAKEAVRLGDRERAGVLYAMVARWDPESAPATKAARDGLRKDAAREAEGLDEEAAARARDARRARVRRTVERSAELLARSRRRAAAAGEPGLPPHVVRLRLAAAEHAAWQAERLVGDDARRAPAADTAWPRPPAEILGAARAQRAEVARTQAVLEIAGGRFALGLRLARLAQALAPGAVPVKAVLEEAERGMMRRGVQIASPPPERE